MQTSRERVGALRDYPDRVVGPRRPALLADLAQRALAVTRLEVDQHWGEPGRRFLHAGLIGRERGRIGIHLQQHAHAVLEGVAVADADAGRAHGLGHERGPAGKALLDERTHGVLREHIRAGGISRRMELAADVQGMAGIALTEQAAWDSALLELAADEFRGRALPRSRQAVDEDQLSLEHAWACLAKR